MLFRLLLLVALSAPAWACIWDRDTLEDELRGLPPAAVLASGRWYRHGPAYYQERIDRLSGKTDLSLDEFDDLAVAYERLERRKEALEVLQAKAEKLKAEPDPEHQYRYHANRATILAHSGQLEEALEELELALELNPEAHFGREEYQVLLIRYVQAARGNAKLWSEHNFLSYSGHLRSDGPWVYSRSPSFTAIVEEEKSPRERSFLATAGMLRFGGLEGPELYRTLGDLSLAQGDLNLAWLFYLEAIQKEHPASEQIEATVRQIEEHWEEAGYHAPTREQWRIDRDVSQRWLQAFQTAEAEALESGQDLDANLEDLIHQADRAVETGTWRFWTAVVALVLLLMVLPLRKRFNKDR